MSFEVQGKLHEKFDEQKINDSFKKREFVLEIEDGNYTQHIKFQLTQDRCDLLNDFNKGENVQVSFSLAGRPYTNKDNQTVYFTNLNAWRIVKDEYNQAAPEAAVPMPTTKDEVASDTNDDLPF